MVGSGSISGSHWPELEVGAKIRKAGRLLTIWAGRSEFYFHIWSGYCPFVYLASPNYCKSPPRSELCPLLTEVTNPSA